MLDFKRDRSVWGFAAFWSALVLMIDVVLGVGLVQAVRSAWFPATPGIITRSDTGPGGKGSVHFHVAYTYTVNGQQYTGTKFHVQPQFVGNRYWLAAHDANPAGTPVTVYYDPDDPHIAFLVPGLRSDSLFIVWWLTPFNLVMIGFAWVGWGQLTGRREFDPALRRCVRVAPDGWIVRPDPDSRFIVVAFICLGLSTFLGCFVCMGYVLIFDFPPPWVVPILMWVGAFSATVVFAAKGSRDSLVHINELEGTITFRRGGEHVAVASTDIRGLDSVPETRKNKSGSYGVHVVTLRWRDKFEQEQSTRLAVYSEREDAQRLVAWLSERLIPSRVEGHASRAFDLP